MLDGLLKQRIDKPFKRENGKLIECSWDEALNIVGSKIRDRKSNRFSCWRHVKYGNN